MDMKNILDNQTIDKLNKLAEESENSSENSIDSGDRKIEGAIAEVSRRAELDKTIEDNLSTGLNNPEFEAASQKIDKKRNKSVTGFEGALTLKNNISPFVLDDKYKQSMKELEEEMSDSFNKEVYSRLAEMNKVLLLDHLVDNSLSQEKSEIINLNVVSDGNYNVVTFSDNGYLMQLTNKEEVKIDGSFDVKNEKAQYSLIAPNGTVLLENKSYQEAVNTLETLSNGYLKVLKEEFAKQKDVPENTTETSTETEGAVNNSNTSINIENTPKINDNKLEFEANKENIEKEFADSDAAKNSSEVPESKSESKLEPKSESAIKNPFNEKVTNYAKSIGIKVEDLTANQEFVALTPEQQQFALETLRRTSLSKATVEAHQTFAEEKAGKKWWQIGFVMNQNFHKERHKIEAIKNIESRGLEGYGETELAWLTEVIKNGPEIKVNDAGEVIVNCLSDSGFSDEQKKIIAKYNEEARNYIESSDKDNYNLRDIKNNLLSNCIDEERGCTNEELERLFYSLNESEKNIQLLKFLSANKETEEMIQKMASRSLTGFDKAKAMVGAQKDKAGYSALGFALRTGSKFALANSAYVASALTYSTAPLVAAIVGGLRGYNQGKKSLEENEELAQLGVTDKSATAKALNLAVGENSLKDKLDNLVDKLEKLRTEYGSEEEIKKVEKSLQARIYYTQGQMNKESVFYGSTKERGVNYLELTNSLVRANSMFWKNTDLLINSKNYYYTSDKTKELTRQSNLHKGIGLFNKIPDASDPKYREWAQDKKRFDELQKISVEDRLASFLNYKEDIQSRKELKFLIKKTATGAVMGASFAAVGSFVAEHLNISSWLNHTSNGHIAMENSTVTSSENVDVPKVTDDNIVRHVVKTEPAELVPDATPETPAETLSPDVTNENISDTTNSTEVLTQDDSVVVDNSMIDTEITPSISVDEVIHNQVTSPTEIISQEVVDDKEAAYIAMHSINPDSNTTEITDGLSSNSENFRTEEDFLKQVSEINNGVKLSADEQLEVKNIYDSFKQDGDYDLLRKKLVNFEYHISGDHSAEAVMETPVESQTKVMETPILDNTQEVVDVEETASSLEVVNPESSVADKIAVATELHTNPESLEQVGDNLIYKGVGKSNLIFDLKADGIKEAVDVNGKKIPKEFIDELIGDTKLSKFTRSGGLEKIFTSWNKLGSNDKLIYENLNLFNKKIMRADDLLNQIKVMHRVNIENVFVDSDSKHFVINNGKSFNMTLKGVKKMVTYLSKK